MGLGGFPEVSLKDARELAVDYRKMARQGIDPIKTRSQQRRDALRRCGGHQLPLLLHWSS